MRSPYLVLPKVKLALTAEAQVEDVPEPEPEAPAAGVHGYACAYAPILR